MPHSQLPPDYHSWTRRIPKLITVRFSNQLLAVLLAGGLLTSAYAQRPNLEPGLDGDQPVPTVTFEWASPEVVPAHYAITVDSSGRAAYLSDDLGPGGTTEAETGTPYLLNFTISDGTAARIFALARQAGYFNGNFEYGEHHPGNRAVKTLRYSEGTPDWFGHWTRGVRNTATYDYTNNQVIQQLTTLFEQLSATIELGRRLDYFRQSNTSALVNELQRADALAQQHRLLELPAIAEPLRSVANDSALPSPARKAALKLLAAAQVPAAGR
jgi:hypothetical protein